jgi:hypothetical protein
MMFLPVIASDSEAIQSDKQELDWFVASLLAMTSERALAHHLKKKSRALALL